jgi:hypothetical protein
MMILKGMKFALTEIKLVLAKTLRVYNVNACSDAPAELELFESYLIRKPKHGINISLTKRDI